MSHQILQSKSLTNKIIMLNMEYNYCFFERSDPNQLIRSEPFLVVDFFDWTIRTDLALNDKQYFYKFSDILQQMSKRAQNQIRKMIEGAGQPSQIEQLNLDDIQIKNLTTTIKKMIETCTKLEYITMNNCSLKSLENFPILKNLIGLELSDNSIPCDDLIHLRKTPHINFLRIDCNKINYLSNLRGLASLEQLQILQIHDNQVTNIPNYRDQIFTMLPSLKVIDCQDRTGEQVEQEDLSQCYYSQRDHRSKIDLTDLIDDDQEEPNNNVATYPKTAPDYLEEGRDSRDTYTSPRSQRVSFYMNRNLLNFTPNMMTIRNRFNDNFSDSQQERDLISDFRKKFTKKD